MSPRETDVDRFKGTEWEDAVGALRKDALESVETDGHSLFDNLLRMDSHAMLSTIKAHEKTISKLTSNREKMQLRIDLLQKLHPLQEKFEKAQHEADAKNRSQDEYEFGDDDPSPDVGYDEQLKTRRNNFKKAETASGSGTRNIPYKGALPNVNNGRLAGLGGIFLGHKQKNAGPGNRGAVMMQAAHEKNEGRTVAEQRAAPRKKGDLNLVKMNSPADVYRPPTASRTSRRAREDDAEYLPGFPAPAQNTLFSPPLKTSVRNAARKTECIELLSDDEEADGAGPAGTIVLGGDDVQRVSTRPTRSSVKLSIPDRIGNIKVIYPTMSQNKTHGSGASAMPSIGTVEVTSRDLLTLEDYEFLNDSVIEFFIKNLQHNMKPDVAKRCHIFNSFFFEKLSNDREERSEPADVKQRKAHERVAKWTKGFNIFEKDFVFFPIHGNTHWSLMVLCHPACVQQTEPIDDDDGVDEVPMNQRPGPFLLHLDSMSGGHKTSMVATRLREYLAMEWLRLNPNTKPQSGLREGETTLFLFTKDLLQQKRMKVPQQDNGCDCGVFLCMFFKHFFLHDLKNPKLPDRMTPGDVMAAWRQDTSPFPALPEGFLRRDWFPPEEASKARSELMFDILEQLRKNVDPITAKEQGADDKTVKNLEFRLANIDAVMKEVEDRLKVRSEYGHGAIAERKRKKQAEQDRKRQREEEREADRKAHVPFTGGSNTLRGATANTDGGEASNPVDFYGGAWGKPVKSSMQRRSDEGNVDLMTQDSDSPRGAGRRLGTGKVLTGIENAHEPTKNAHEPRWASFQYTPAAKPPKNTEDGAESEEDFEIKTHPTPERQPTCYPASPVKVIDVYDVDDINERVDAEKLQSESESEEEVQCTASPPRTRETRQNTKQTTIPFKTAAASASEAAQNLAKDVARKNQKKEKNERRFSNTVAKAQRRVLARSGNSDVDLTAASGGNMDVDDENEAGLGGTDDEMDHDAFAG